MDAKWTTLIVAGLIITSSFAAEKRGGLVLQFDDGWTSWATVIAPEVQKVGGVASCFVNNQNIRSGRITRDDLLTLQNTYHWEIGTHTWHHLNAPSYIRKNGMDAWMDQELMNSIRERRGMGLDIRSLVFPFNLKRAVQSRGSATELFIPMPDKPSRELEKDLIAMHDRLKHLSP